MSRSSPSTRIFAERLIACEAVGKRFSRQDATGALPVLEKLRPLLGTLMGSGGFRTLLSRALVLTNAEVAWTRAVHVKADGGLEGWGALSSQVDVAERQEGSITLLSHLLGLMIVFIGPTLTAQLLGEIWPKISPDDLNFNQGEKNEKKP